MSLSIISSTWLSTRGAQEPTQRLRLVQEDGGNRIILRSRILLQHVRAIPQHAAAARCTQRQARATVRGDCQEGLASQHRVAAEGSRVPHAHQLRLARNTQEYARDIH